MHAYKQWQCQKYGTDQVSNFWKPCYGMVIIFVCSMTLMFPFSNFILLKFSLTSSRNFNKILCETIQFGDCQKPLDWQHEWPGALISWKLSGCLCPAEHSLKAARLSILFLNEKKATKNVLWLINSWRGKNTA